MHVVYVTAAMRDETYIVPEVMELQKRGHQVTLVPVRPHRPVLHKDARAITTIAQPVISLSIICNALAEIVRAPRLVIQSARRLAKSRNASIFLKNLVVFPKGLWLARVAKQKNVDHLHAHFASTSATVALVASSVSGIPWSFTAHRWDISENNLLDQKVETAVFARAIDARGGQELKSYLKANQQKVCVIYMGVTVRNSSHHRAAQPGRRPLRVLLAARFDELKGHRYALDAIARLTLAGVEVSLDCAGHGPLKETIEKYAIALDLLDRVQFPGLIDHQELMTQLGEHRWDVALLPSLETHKDREGIPVFLIEAMAAGVPVVGTNTGGIPELLENGAGILVPQRDAAAIAEALVMIGADDNFRLQLAEAGTQRVRDQFTIESTISALLDEIASRSQSNLQFPPTAH